MRILVCAAIVLLFMPSCQVDELVPCASNPELSRLLCREYRYVDDNIYGYVEFTYSGDSIIKKEAFDQGAKLIKSTTERYQGGMLQTMAEELDNATVRVTTYHYLSNDSLERIVYGAADSSIYLHYTNGMREKATTYHGSALARYHTYRYHQSDGKLFRISFFDEGDNLLYYHTYEYFYGNRLRIDQYSSQHVHLGYEIIDRMPDGQILSSQFTDTTLRVLQSIENTFDASGLLTETREQTVSGNRKRLFFYH